MNQPLNPFLVEGYISSRYFCDREEESDKLIEALKNGRNVSLISPRRMGKSGLIHHAFSRIIKDDPEARCFYIDLFHTYSLRDFINAFANAVFGRLDNTLEKLYNNIVSVFRHCRPSIYPDPISGTPTLTLNMSAEEENPTLRDIFEYLKKSDKRVYVAFDEFQQIAEYPGNGIEGLLRGYIQFIPNANFVFAGSKKHMMHEMFQIPARPFYQSTQTLSLSPISKDKYYAFCQKFFVEKGKELSQEAFDFVYDSVMGHTWYVQYWMSRMYDSAPKRVDVIYAKSILNTILREEDDNFYSYRQLLTTNQLKVMRGLAKARTLATPLRSEELAALDMGAPSTVRSCLKTLAEKELIIEDKNKYSVYNRFFMLWLAAY